MNRTALGFVAMIGLAVSAGLPLSAQTSTIIQRVLVKVNGEIFTQKQLEQRQIGLLREQGKDKPTPQDIAAITADLLVSAVDEMLLLQNGKELGYGGLTDEQFRTRIDMIKKDSNLNDADFKIALTQEGLTLDSLRENFDKQNIIRAVQQQQILGKVTLTEEEARQYYEKHPDEFLKPATVTLREILILVPAAPTGQAQMFAASSVANADAAAMEKIKGLRDRAEKGEDFAKLVTEASDSSSKATGGVIGPVNLEEMATGIRDLIDKMKVGEITPPVKTPRGYQIFKLESRTEKEAMPFQSVRDEIAQKVGEAQLDVRQKKYIETLRTQALIEWKRDDLKQMYEKRMADLTR